MTAGVLPAIGIFGGTFDPIHFGHLRTAFECLERLRLDHVRFVPCADPPHRARPFAPAAARLEMVAAAVDGIAGFVADAREFDRGGPSFTVDTLRSLAAEFGDRSLSLIVGLDAFAGMDGWHEWQRIFELAHIVVARRPGAMMPVSGPIGAALAERRTEDKADLEARSAGRILVMDVTQLDISSTDLRNSIAAGVRPVYLLPDSVWSVIQRAGCYGA